MFIKVYGLQSPTKLVKCIIQEDSERDKYTVNDQLYNIRKEDAHIKRDTEAKLFSLTYGTILTSIKFNNFGTQR